MKLSQADLKVVHEKLLEMLKYFKQFCAENNLTFYLAYGTCLGAVREHGFIPWDDDVDIVMPPEDYKRFRELWPPQTTRDHYTLCDTTEDYCDHHMALTIRDDNTTYINEGDRNSDTHHGIMIEIGPFSYCPKSKFRRLLQTVNACAYAVFKTQRIPNSGGKAQKLIVLGLLNIVRSRKQRYKIWHSAEQRYVLWDKDNNGYVRNFGQMHTLKRYFPANILDGVEWLVFEDTTMPVVANYEEYLTLLYGDYMTPPPVEKRVPPHEVVFVDCDISYKEYKGIYYLNGSRG